MPFCCPVCGSPLRLEGKAASCDEGHSFDLARERYLNLLTGHEARRKPRGDAREMVEARRGFLSEGHYAPMTRGLAGLIDAELGRQDHPGAIVLDLGCGEGSVLCGVISERGGAVWAGIDVSRDAIRAAGRLCGQRAWLAVANLHRLPVADRSVSLCLSVFAQLDGREVTRVLRPDGRLIAVGPGRDHLAGLRSRLYDTPREHDEQIVPVDLPAMRRAWEERIRFDLDLRQPSVGRLLAMTPYYWSASPQTQEAVASMSRLKTPADFLIQCFELGESGAR